ncbi:MAG: hypothetical protein M9921_09665 [Fimbriimonadaceae bacterium]|nr:hypothetical protein [Fimbriimonadaceae bacterium]
MDSAGLILEATLAHARERNDLRATGEILQNLGQIAFERKLYAKAALSEVVGTLLLLDFGYSEEFRRLAKSSMVTLCASLFELGFDEEARTTRTLIDRLGAAPLYAPNQRLFERLEKRTFTQPPKLKVAIAGEREVRDHLARCVDRLRSLPSAGQAADWLSVMHSVVGAG